MPTVLTHLSGSTLWLVSCQIPIPDQVIGRTNPITVMLMVLSLLSSLLFSVAAGVYFTVQATHYLTNLAGQTLSSPFSKGGAQDEEKVG